MQDPEVELLMTLTYGDHDPEDLFDLFVSCVEWSCDLEDHTWAKVVPASLVSVNLSDGCGEAMNQDKRASILSTWFSGTCAAVDPCGCTRNGKQLSAL